jgi:ATP-dependent helicase/nuclease subunit B
MARLYTIAPEEPFLDALAAGLLADAAAEPLALARHTILLPTRRAVRALGEAFLRASEGRPLLLPRLVPVGDLDADELMLLGDEGPSEGDLDIPPAIPDLRRRLILTRLVLKWGEQVETGPRTPGQAAPLAAALARFLDEVQAEGGRLEDLDNLVPEEHAEHWQKVLSFLGIVREFWPSELAERGAIDPAERRTRVLEAQGARWLRHPPAHRVIAAGITGGVAAVGTLLEAVAALPTGAIVLPGLAQDCDEETWGEIASDPSHPQHLMARLLRRLGVRPADIEAWPHRVGRGAPAGRRRLVFEAMRPAQSTERWRTMAALPKDALQRLTRIDCPGPREEALVIALLLRETLQRPGETAALVTPDRELARRVAAELRRWGIEIDDSAGVPLNRTPPGVFLRLVLAAAAEALAPVPLLALLKHPLAALGLAPETCRALARRLETEVLRGPRPAPGLAGLEAALSETARAPELHRFVARIGEALRPLVEALVAREATLGPLLAAHVAAAEAVARSDLGTGAGRLWAEEAGEAAAQAVDALLEAAPDCPPLAGADYPPLFESLLAEGVVRPRYGRHPRLFIWGLLEARLQQADRLVLGSLNEGVWPAATAHDPWLSRPMRAGIGLPPPERRIGLAAHDFAQAMGAREVVLTRASRVEGTPTVPSRWLLRLEAVLETARSGLARQDHPPWLAWQARLDEERRRPVRAPAPAPPVIARPRRLTVTEIETWMRDPYAIFARRILRLKALEALDAAPNAADRGTIIHEALDKFLNRYDALPEDALARLLEAGREAFGAALERPGVRAFWWPRFERIAAWFIAQEERRHGLISAVVAECNGRLVLDGPAGPFELMGRADRIDTLVNGGLAIVDFKTGSLPKVEEVTLGYAPQLALEAAIAEAGGFDGVPEAPVRELAFWKLGAREELCEIRAIEPGELRARIAGALQGLRRLIARFDDPATPYLSVPRPARAPRYGDYAHLARVKERLAEEDRE